MPLRVALVLMRARYNAAMSNPFSHASADAASVCNIAAALPRLAAERPEQIAIRCPAGVDAQGRVQYTQQLS